MRRARMVWLVGVLTALVALAGSASAVAAAKYVALGDSFAAGPMIPVQVQPWGCLKSSNNYARLAAPRLGLDLGDATCSGAKTNHMTQPQDVWPDGNAPQFDALGPETQLVTLNIGGNDIGFSSLAEDCMSTSPNGTKCKDMYVVNGVDEMSTRIANTAPKVAAVLQGIKDRAPSATIRVLNYAAIFPDSGPGCYPVLPVADGDVAWLREKHKELNQMLADQAATAGASIVDWYTASIGHDACQLPAIKWVEPVAPTSPAAPLHPNLDGMKAAADLVVAAGP